MKMITASLILLLLLSAAHATPQMKTGPYAVVTVQMGPHSYDAIRWNRTSGKSYLLRSQAWQAIPETAEDTELPEGTYDVQFISLQNDWGAIRINTETGESWTMAEGQWVPIESTPENPALDTAAETDTPVLDGAVPMGSADTETEDDTSP